MEKRNYNIDLIKTIAFLLVVTKHFISYIGHPALVANNIEWVIITFLKVCTLVCVPLFLMSTGFLQIDKEIKFNLTYIKKLKYIIIPYLVVSCFTILINVFFLNKTVNIPSMLFGITGNGYAWYVGMYLGLYMLIPFLNVGWNNLDKNGKRTLLVILFCLTSLPHLFNIKATYLPSYFTQLYPTFYYFLGGYIKQYEPHKNIKKSLFIITYFVSALLYTLFLLFVNYGNALNTIDAYFDDYKIPFIVICSISVFCILLKINIKHKNTLSQTSILSFSAYLFSWIPDNFLFGFVIMAGSTPIQRLWVAIPYILFVATISLLFSKFVNLCMKRKT